VKGDLEHTGFSTRAVHAGQDPEAVTGAVIPPIFQTSTYAQEALGVGRGFEYARGENPTRSALERNIAVLEGGLSGHAFASGMAAVSALLTLVGSGQRVVASRTVYGGTYRYFTRVLDRTGIDFVWVDTGDLAAVAAAVTPATRLVFVETPTNPLMEITDLAAVAAIAHAQGALLAVDNTFLSPYFQQPLALGADVVLHSATKFLNGHSDALGGLLVAARQEESEWFAFVQKSAGAILGPFDSFLILRGIRTLAVRMERHESNARAIVELLAGHPKVKRVLHPSLPDNPGHAVQRRQARGFGAVISFDLGSYEAARTLLNRVEVMTLAESLGGVETLISHPASMTHASVPEARRRALGIGDGLVRVSVGIEDVADLLRDFEQALDAVAAPAGDRESVAAGSLSLP
jgi:cystathionine beta-lyase/cystathionine gamma-synthase